MKKTFQTPRKILLNAALVSMCGFFTLASTTFASDIQLTEASKSHQMAKLNGQSMAQVLETLGSPAKQHPPVGAPAITRWDYESLSVYFEGNRVLHTVMMQDTKS